MPRRLIQLYQRKRIININMNVIAAGLLAIACTKCVIWAVDLFLDRGHHLLFTIVALVSDMIFDVAIYYVLHWLANHAKPKPVGGAKPPAFFKDATLIQFERALLSPIYYLLAGALMQILQDFGWIHGWAMVVAFTSGLVVTRILHTAMGLYTGSFRDLPGLTPPAGADPGSQAGTPEARRDAGASPPPSGAASPGSAGPDGEHRAAAHHAPGAWQGAPKGGETGVGPPTEVGGPTH